MSFAFVQEYATEGAPLLIADAEAAERWRGRDDDGSGAVVEYMGYGIDELPKGMAAKPGRASKKFKTVEDARVFLEEVLAAFSALHPRAARHPQYPQQSAYYLDGKRVFSAEAKFTSAFDALLRGLKSDAQTVVMHAKKKGLAFQQDGGGRGVVAASDDCAVVAKLHRAVPLDEVLPALTARKRPKAKGKVALGGRVVIFDAALSATTIARANRVDALGALFAAGSHGSLRIPDQALPCAAYVTLPKGEYEYSFAADVDLGPTGANALWLQNV